MYLAVASPTVSLLFRIRSAQPIERNFGELCYQPNVQIDVDFKVEKIGPLYGIILYNIK